MIQKCEVQTEIIAELFMVPGMVCCTDQPFAYRMLVESFGVDLIPEVVDESAHRHDHEQHQQYHSVHGYDHQYEWQKEGLYDGFQRMKGERGPWGSDMAIVVDLMNDPVYGRDMHPAMEQVVVTLVQDHDQDKAQGEVPPSVQAPIQVDKGIAF